MKKLYIIILLCNISYSCNSREDGNKYLFDLNKELSPIKHDPKQVNVIYNREKKKFEESKNDKYLISSKYAELILLIRNRESQIDLAFELLKLNKGKYEYITIACNYNLATQFEISSPQWAFKYIDIAIDTDEKMGLKYYLPHLYHFKGRLFYNQGKYTTAMDYFNKALNTYNTEDVLYIASMHNNLGMCYDKMNNSQKAIYETKLGIALLEEKSNPSKDKNILIYFMKSSLADYLIKMGDYNNAEKLLLSSLRFSMENKNHTMALHTSEALFSYYDTIRREPSLEKKIIDSLSVIEPHLTDISLIIKLNEVKRLHYLKLDDFHNLQKTYKKLDNLYKKNIQLKNNELKRMIDLTDRYIINDIEQKNNIQKRDNVILLLTIPILTILFITYIINSRNIKKKRDIIVSKDIELNREKIRNLHLNLNLKSEMEKIFLDNIIKLKKIKNIEPELLLKDLQFKTHNLLEIDKKNVILLSESSEENKIFMDNLSKKFPFLTKQELKLCIYFKLRLSAKEISLIENFTVGSIRVYKTRIKSKIGLKKEENLNEFLNNIKY